MNADMSREMRKPASTIATRKEDLADNTLVDMTTPDGRPQAGSVLWRRLFEVAMTQAHERSRRQHNHQVGIRGLPPLERVAAQPVNQYDQ
jgi:hypothetical protein